MSNAVDENRKSLQSRGEEIDKQYSDLATKNKALMSGASHFENIFHS